MFNNLTFAQLWWFLLLLPVVYIILRKRKHQQKSIAIPNISAFRQKKSLLFSFYPLLFWLRILCFILLIIALARPQRTFLSPNVQQKNGVDIILTVDISTSMLAKDLLPDRLTALKEVAQNFVAQRKLDRIGLVAYSNEALSLVPLTLDKYILKQQIKQLNPNMFDGGTAIGLGLATAVNHLKDSKAKSRIIILMTDGVNNDGMIDPTLAADIAKNHHIKVYTIGIGTNGYALFPARQNPDTQEIYYEERKVEIDEPSLKYIAQHTGGTYFRATNTNTLEEIYKQINLLEKSPINDLRFYQFQELYYPFVLTAIVLILLELILRVTWFKTLQE